MTCATHVARGSLVKWACYGDLRALHHVVSCPGLSSVRPWTKRSSFFLNMKHVTNTRIKLENDRLQRKLMQIHITLHLASCFPIAHGRCARFLTFCLM